MNLIRDLRKKSKITQTQLAEICNTTTSNISGWECGKWQPDNDALLKLADYFDVSVDYLLGRENKKNLIERPSYEITDKQLIDFIKLYEVMTDLQKAHILGYVIAYLETNGVNVKTVLGY